MSPFPPKFGSNCYLVGYGSKPAARNFLQSSRPREVIYLTTNTAILIVAIITAAIAFAALILKIVEVSRNK
jgi:hypothetical protein